MTFRKYSKAPDAKEVVGKGEHSLAAGRSTNDRATLETSLKLSLKAEDYRSQDPVLTHHIYPKQSVYFYRYTRSSMLTEVLFIKVKKNQPRLYIIQLLRKWNYGICT